MSEDVKLNLKKLEDILKIIKNASGFKIRVGIIGDKAQRSDGGGPNNATIGTFHEFGTSTLPERSFLNMPLRDHFPNALAQTDILNEDSLRKMSEEKSILPLLKQVAVVAEATVLEAFDTGGFGSWPPSDMKNKTNHQTLVESTQLRNSISYEILEGKKLA